MSNYRRLLNYGPDLTEPAGTPSKLPAKICLISAVVLMFALMGFIMFTGSAVLYVHFWVYIVAVILIVLLLLPAGALTI